MASSSTADARRRALRPRDRWVSFMPARATPSRFDGAVDDDFEPAFNMSTAPEPNVPRNEEASLEHSQSVGSAHTVAESYSDFQSACEFQADWPPHAAQSLSPEHFKFSKSSEQPLERSENHASTPANRLPIHISQMLHWSERNRHEDDVFPPRSPRRPVYRPRQPQASIQREERLQEVRFIRSTPRERVEAFLSRFLVFLWAF